jgi:hypothetical protein
MEEPESEERRGREDAKDVVTEGGRPYVIEVTLWEGGPSWIISSKLRKTFYEDHVKIRTTPEESSDTGKGQSLGA